MSETNNYDLNTLYTTSYWSKRLPQKEVVPHHLNFIKQASDCTVKNLECKLNRAYGETDRQKIDIIGTDLPKESSIFIFLHGGYWQEKKIHRSGYHFLAESLYAQKIKSILVGYDLCPEFSLSEIIQQVQKAIKKCLEYGLKHKSDGVYIMGHSAGAHLTASLFTKSFFETLSKDEQALLKACFLTSGIYDLVPIQKTTINNAVGLDYTTAKELSPAEAILAKNILTKFFVIVGEFESSEFKNQSKIFVEKLTNEGLYAKYWLIEKVDHFDIIENLKEKDFSLTSMIVDIIKVRKDVANNM